MVSSSGGHGVPTERTKTVFDLIVDNAQTVGSLKTIKDKTYVDFGVTTPISLSDQSAAGTVDDEKGDPTGSPLHRTDTVAADPGSTPNRTRPDAIFLGHGKNRQPLEQLV
jgi:hypothetical protein